MRRPEAVLVGLPVALLVLSCSDASVRGALWKKIVANSAVLVARPLMRRVCAQLGGSLFWLSKGRGRSLWVISM